MVKLFTAIATVFLALGFRPQGAFGQSDADCGNNDVVGMRIVGGDDVVKHSIPWQAAIVSTGSNSPWCGGTIIDSTHILTAAHCVPNTSPTSIQVLTGEHDTTVAQGETRHNVKNIVNHPSYGSQTGIDYDFSILEIDCGEQIDLTDKARAACLPNSVDYEVSGAMFNVSGWGRLVSGGQQPDVLNVVSVPFIEDSVCTDKYAAAGQTITDQMICAGNLEEGGIDSCQGDSGGPLTWRDGAGKWNIIGVVSWGIGCADARFPGVYAEVFKALDWVKSNSQAGGSGTCDGTNPNPTTTTEAGESTTSASEGGCVSEWIGDSYCDDDNNTEECEFDGGDCCPGSDPMEGWDDFCSDCECLNEPCDDQIPTRRCETFSFLCGFNWFEDICPKTCGAC